MVARKQPPLKRLKCEQQEVVTIDSQSGVEGSSDDEGPSIMRSTAKVDRPRARTSTETGSGEEGDLESSAVDAMLRLGEPSYSLRDALRDVVGHAPLFVAEDTASPSPLMATEDAEGLAPWVNDLSNSRVREGGALSETDNNEDQYWIKRQRNNEAARRSRDRRRQNDAANSRKIEELTTENRRLREELRELKVRFELPLGEEKGEVESTVAVIAAMSPFTSSRRRQQRQLQNLAGMATKSFPEHANSVGELHSVNSNAIFAATGLQSSEQGQEKHGGPNATALIRVPTETSTSQIVATLPKPVFILSPAPPLQPSLSLPLPHLATNVLEHVQPLIVKVDNNFRRTSSSASNQQSSVISAMHSIPTLTSQHDPQLLSQILQAMPLLAAVLQPSNTAVISSSAEAKPNFQIMVSNAPQNFSAVHTPSPYPDVMNSSELKTQVKVEEDEHHDDHHEDLREVMPLVAITEVITPILSRSNSAHSLKIATSDSNYESDELSGHGADDSTARSNNSNSKSNETASNFFVVDSKTTIPTNAETGPFDPSIAFRQNDQNGTFPVVPVPSPQSSSVENDTGEGGNRQNWFDHARRDKTSSDSSQENIGNREVPEVVCRQRLRNKLLSRGSTLASSTTSAIRSHPPLPLQLSNDSPVSSALVTGYEGFVQQHIHRQQQLMGLSNNHRGCRSSSAGVSEDDDYNEISSDSAEDRGVDSDANAEGSRGTSEDGWARRASTTTTSAIVDPKYEERRQRNNMAARKCRQSKKILMEIRLEQTRQLERENGKLKEEVETLSKEIVSLRELFEKKKKAQTDGKAFQIVELKDQSDEV